MKKAIVQVFLLLLVCVLTFAKNRKPDEKEITIRLMNDLAPGVGGQGRRPNQLPGQIRARRRQRVIVGNIAPRPFNLREGEDVRQGHVEHI